MSEERRHKFLQGGECLDMLSMPQEVSLLELFQFGFKLDFVRNTDEGSVAIASNSDSTLTIDQHGIVDHRPGITFRR